MGDGQIEWVGKKLDEGGVHCYERQGMRGRAGWIEEPRGYSYVKLNSLIVHAIGL